MCSLEVEVHIYYFRYCIATYIEQENPKSWCRSGLGVYR
jgi:hypothetical protein